MDKKGDDKNDDDTIFEIGASAMVTFLENPKFQNKLIDKLNKNVDIPFINEATEEKIIRAICVTIVDALRESL